MWSKRIPFKVDIAGVIEIMGSSLYSRPDTPIRELIQNAHDAIMRRRNRDLDYQGRIDIEQDAAANTLSFTDDGIGLSPAKPKSTSVHLASVSPACSKVAVTKSIARPSPVPATQALAIS